MVTEQGWSQENISGQTLSNTVEILSETVIDREIADYRRLSQAIRDDQRWSDRDARQTEITNNFINEVWYQLSSVLLLTAFDSPPPLPKKTASGFWGKFFGNRSCGITFLFLYFLVIICVSAFPSQNASASHPPLMRAGNEGDCIHAEGLQPRESAHRPPAEGGSWHAHAGDARHPARGEPDPAPLTIFSQFRWHCRWEDRWKRSRCFSLPFRW